MGQSIQDGSGTGNRAKVFANHRLAALSIIESEAEAATQIGLGVNVNSGWFNLTGAADSAVIYLKNTDPKSFVCVAIAVGIGTAQGGGSFADLARITLIRNPSTGTIVSGATVVDMKQNRNFGHAEDFATLTAYKGADGLDFTDGDDIAVFGQAGGGRLFATIEWELPKGSSIGINVDPNLASGDVDVYAAIIGHFRDPDSE